MAQVASQRVVNGIATRVLHGKDYVEVSERTRILHELRKSGEIKEFEMVASGPSEIVGLPYWQVCARIDGKLYIGSAEIKADAPKNTPDGTNPISCAETSAFGRMLAFAGLGTVESIASYDEIMRAQPGKVIAERNDVRVVESSPVRQLPQAAQQIDEDAAPTEQQLSSIRKLCERLGKPEPEIPASFIAAKELIGQLTTEYKSRAAQPLKAQVRPTPEEVDAMKRRYGTVFHFKESDYEARWEAAKVHVLGKPTSDPDITAFYLDALRKFADESEKSSGK